jgi:Rrf2 family protein
MRMGAGVEWGLHCCLALAWLDGPGADAVPTAKLATLFDLPPVYLKKRLQALARAGIVVSEPGARGGFRLARAPERITLMDVVVANEGADPAFRCDEIRQRGPLIDPDSPDYQHPCGVATAMRRAELAWRRELARQTVADLMAEAPRSAPGRMRTRYANLPD